MFSLLMESLNHQHLLYFRVVAQEGGLLPAWTALTPARLAGNAGYP